MTELSLPVEYFKKEAKHLLLAVQRGEPRAESRVASTLTSPSDLSLMRAQHVIAVKSGFLKWEDLVNASAIELHLVITMSKVPELNDFGIGNYDGHRKLPKEEQEAIFQKNRKTLRESLDVVERTVNWLKTNVLPIKTVNLRRSSYGIKHIVEGEIGYITNGVLIASAVIAGYPYKTRWDSPNAAFGMSEKSFKTVIRGQRPKVYRHR